MPVSERPLVFGEVWLAQIASRASVSLPQGRSTNVVWMKSGFQCERSGCLEKQVINLGHYCYYFVIAKVLLKDFSLGAGAAILQINLFAEIQECLLW